MRLPSHLLPDVSTRQHEGDVRAVATHKRLQETKCTEVECIRRLALAVCPRLLQREVDLKWGSSAEEAFAERAYLPPLGKE